MNVNLHGKVIVVSGGTKGVGKALVLACARAGAAVVVGGRDAIAGQAIIEQVQKDDGVKGLFVLTDLHRVEDCQNLIDATMANFGRLDGFVNYAGITPAGLLTETPEAVYDDVFAINTKAAFFCAQNAVKAMLKTGGGSIVFIGSGHGYGGEKDRAAYACSKGALLTLMKHIARNYVKEGIRSNWISMGWVATDGELALREGQGRDRAWLDQAAADSIPMGRLSTIEEQVPGILYMLSDDSAMVTGTEIHATGGLMTLPGA